METILASIAGVAGAAALARALFRRETVFEFERGLLFRNGLLKETLPPGAHWLFRMHSQVQKVDIRLRTVSVPSQEVLSADSVTVKITLAAQYLVCDPRVAMTKVEKFQDAFYMILQLALRELVGGLKIEELMEKRQEIGKSLFEKTEARVSELGLILKVVEVKDIMFPGDLKKIFSQVVKARKEGQAILEKARGETAALRNLANAAKMLEGNPALMQLRVLQSVDAGTGNTMILGLPSEVMPLPLKKQGAPASEPPPSPDPRTGPADSDG